VKPLQSPRGFTAAKVPETLVNLGGAEVGVATAEMKRITSSLAAKHPLLMTPEPHAKRYQTGALNLERLVPGVESVTEKI